MGDLFPEMTAAAKDWWVQVLLWKDKRLFGIVSTDLQGDFPSKTQRWSKQQNKHIEIATHQATEPYS